MARFDALLEDCWLTSNPAYDQKDGLPGRRQTPATAATGHASAVTPTVPAAVTKRVGSCRPTARMSRMNSRAAAKALTS